MRTYTVDCGTCPVRHVQCPECIVTLMIGQGVGPTADAVPLDADERAAVRLLVGSGLLRAEAAAGLVARRDEPVLRRVVG